MIAASSTENQFRNSLQVPWRHKGKILLCLVAVVSLTAAATFLMPKTYRSESELLLRLGRENMGLDPTATVGATPILAVQQSRENELNSVVEILRSPYLLSKVVNAFGPDVILGRMQWHSETLQPIPRPTLQPVVAIESSSAASPLSATELSATEVKSSTATSNADNPLVDVQDAVRRLGKKLNVEAVHKSNVVQITYDAADPALAQSVVRRLVENFLADYVRLNRTPGAQEFLSQQTTEAHERLKAKEDELRNLKDKTGLADADARRSIVITRIGHLEDDLLETSAQQASSEAEVKKLHQQLDSLPPTQVVEQTVGFADDASSGMRQQLYALQMREQDLASRFTDDHPQLKEVRQQIADAQAVLKQEPQRTQTKTGPSKPFEEIKVQLLKDEPVLAALKAKTEQLKTDLSTEKQSLDKLNADELRIAQLQREVQLEDANYRKYSDSLEQARIDRAMAEDGKSNVNILQPATFDLKPIKPNVLMNLALAVVVGLIGGLGLAFAAESYSGSVHGAENGHARLPETVLNR